MTATSGSGSSTGLSHLRFGRLNSPRSKDMSSSRTEHISLGRSPRGERQVDHAGSPRRSFAVEGQVFEHPLDFAGPQEFGGLSLRELRRSDDRTGYVLFHDAQFEAQVLEEVSQVRTVAAARARRESKIAPGEEFVDVLDPDSTEVESAPFKVQTKGGQQSAGVVQIAVADASGVFETGQVAFVGFRKLPDRFCQAVSKSGNDRKKGFLVSCATASKARRKTSPRFSDRYFRGGSQGGRRPFSSDASVFSKIADARNSMKRHTVERETKLSQNPRSSG